MTTDFAALLAQATPVTPSRQGKGNGRDATIRFESDANGRPRISINTGFKRRLHTAGQWSSTLIMDIVDQRGLEDDNLVVFLEFVEESDRGVAVSNAFNKEGEAVMNNGSYVSALLSLANGAGVAAQEFYGEWSFSDLDTHGNKFVLTIPAKTDEELQALVAQDEAKKASKAAKADDTETADVEEEVTEQAA